MIDIIISRYDSDDIILFMLDAFSSIILYKKRSKYKYNNDVINEVITKAYIFNCLRIRLLTIFAINKNSIITKVVI